VETLRKLGFHGNLENCHICLQGKVMHSKFSRWKSYAEQSRKTLSPFIDEMSRKVFLKTLNSRSQVAAATLELV